MREKEVYKSPSTDEQNYPATAQKHQPTYSYVAKGHTATP
jgi:hypothetical protein